jgi:hypothetical protein
MTGRDCHEIVFDFLRDETDGPAQLDIGQSFFAQVEDGLETDMEILGDPFRRP